MQENISLNASDSITDAPSHIAPCPDTPKGENDRSGDSSALADIDLPRSFSEISHIGSTLHARVLDWDEPLPSWISSGLCGSTDGTGGVVESTWPDLVMYVPSILPYDPANSNAIWRFASTLTTMPRPTLELTSQRRRRNIQYRLIPLPPPNAHLVPQPPTPLYQP